VVETLWLCSDLVMQRMLRSSHALSTLKEQGVTQHDRSSLRNRRFSALPVAWPGVVAPRDEPRISRSALAVMDRLIASGLSALGLEEALDTGSFSASMYHCRGTALALAKTLVRSIIAAKRQIGYFGTADSMSASLRDQIQFAEKCWDLPGAHVFRVPVTVCQRVWGMTSDRWFQFSESTSVYRGPNPGLLQFCLLRLITIFELDEQQVFSSAVDGELCEHWVNVVLLMEPCAEMAPVESRAPVVREDRALKGRRAGDSGLVGLSHTMRERALQVQRLNQ
jgi:hypothetical protein